MLNLHGELIGLTTSYAAIHGGDTPGGFAVPIDASFRRILDVLMDGEEVEYGLLGVSWKPSQGKGVVIDSIKSGSPAADAKMESEDRICEVAGFPIHDVDDLFLYLGTQLAGSRVKIVVERGSRFKPERVALEVTLAKLYIPGARIYSVCNKVRPFDRGLRVEYTSMLIRTDQSNVGKIPKGVLVDEVRPGSSADRAGLRPGELITHVNRQQINNPASYKAAVDKAAAGPIELTVGAADSKIDRKVVLQ